MTTRELDRAPGLAGSYGRAVLGMVLRSAGERVPDEELVLADVAVDRDALGGYQRVCGFRVGDVLPATYPHVLAFPLAMRLMAERSFPLPLPGLVHIANTVTQRRPVTAAERLTLRVRAADLRPHPRGRQVDVRASATVDGEQVWSGVSTYLARGAGADPAAAGPAEFDGEPPDTGCARWRVDGGTGRAYAGVAGDLNPIHLHPLTARAFGFPRAIAHGMWAKARCLAELEGRLPDAFEAGVRFARPLLLPSTVRYCTAREADGWRFAVRRDRDGGLHLDGRVTPVGG